MQKILTKPTLSFIDLPTRHVSLYIKSQLIILTGKWQWEMFSDAVFCSDVIISFPIDIIGTVAIIHPDDLQMLLERIEMSKEVEVDVEFRIITTYGELKTLTGQDVVLLKDEESLESGIEKSIIEKASREKEYVQENDVFVVQKQAAGFAESIAQLGTWYINAVTNEAYYSDGVFRVFGLPPQSLNAHLNTFIRFIHPNEKDAAVEAFEKSYKEQLPLHIQFRIIRPDQQERQLQYASHWTYNEKGERVLIGVMQDITSYRSIEQENEQYQDHASLQSNILQLNEQLGGLGHWHINLHTRKTTFSEIFYRIHGLKAPSLPAGLNYFITYIHPDDRQMIAAIFDKVLLHHVAPDVEYRIIRNDGKIRYLRLKGRLVTFRGFENGMIGTVRDITIEKRLERKIAEMSDDVRRRELLWAKSEEVTGIASLTCDLSTGEINWSENFYSLLGLKLNSVKLTEKYFLSVVHPEDKIKVSNALKVTENSTDNQLDFRIIAKKEIKNLRGNFNIISDREHKILVVTLVDVTQETTILGDLVKRLQLAESLSENISDRVIVTDINHSIILWNKSCEQVYEIKEEQVLNKNLFEIFPSLDIPEQHELYNRTLSGEAIYLKEFQSVTRKERINLHLLPLKNDENKITGILHIIHDVTREFDLQQSLSLRLSFIENLLETTVHPIMVLDRNLNFLVWNKKAEEYYNRRKQQVIGRNVLEVFPGLINNPVYNGFRRALKGEFIHLPANAEEENTSYDETYLIPQKNETETINAVLWILHDLTIEIKLIREQKRAQQILDAINEGCCELDKDSTIVYVNRKAEKIFKRNKEELVGRNVWDIFPESLTTDFYVAIKNSLENKKYSQHEYFSAVLGRWVSLSATPTDEGVIILFSEIEQFREARERLAEEHRRLKEAQSIAHIGSFEFDLLSGTVSWTDELYRIMGIDIGITITFERAIECYDVDQQSLIRENVENALKNAQPFVFEAPMTRQNDGERRFISVTATPVINEQGQVVKLQGTAQDITRHKLTEQKFRETNNLLQSIVNTTFGGMAYQSAIHNQEGKVVDFKYHMVNAVYAAGLGLSVEEMLGKTILTLFPNLKNTELWLRFLKVMQTAEKYRFIEERHENGADSWYDQQYEKVGDGLLIWQIDVTSIKNLGKDK